MWVLPPLAPAAVTYMQRFRPKTLGQVYSHKTRTNTLRVLERCHFTPSKDLLQSRGTSRKHSRKNQPPAAFMTATMAVAWMAGLPPLISAYPSLSLTSVTRLAPASAVSYSPSTKSKEESRFR
jgi:hypothetical protein